MYWSCTQLGRAALKSRNDPDARERVETRLEEEYDELGDEY